jgi:hypothetical protein
MMAVVVSLVYRRIPSLSEVLRVLEVEGLLWVEPLKVTKQALSKRLASLPAQLFAQVFEQVMDRMRGTQVNLPLAVGWEGIHQNFTALWIADGSTLEALKKALNQPKERISVEMVFRGLYHFARAFLRGDSTDVVAYLLEHYKLLGLVKAERKRHRDKVALSSPIWVASG